jgi:hypothetical protein
VDFAMAPFFKRIESELLETKGRIKEFQDGEGVVVSTDAL